MWKLILAFTVIPAVELFLLLQIGAWLGPWQTFLIVVGTGTLGAWLAKREGLGVLSQLSEELRNGLPPGSRLAEGVLVLAGGLLLITPGVLTDLAGFLFIAPPTRRWLAPRVVNAIASRFDFVELGPGRSSSGGGPQPTLEDPHHPFSNPFDDLP
ncbi:MAG: FxsA family protein [Alphaproteobacteria bacterium]|nr:FxsA family protein [Alphaproteobacteria bacterium]